jgi:hypothetical protein
VTTPLLLIEVKKMSQHEHKHEKMEPENIKEILGVVSTEIPTMIKSILSSVFSEEAGRNMGKAAAAYYKELKNGGLPEQVAVNMTEEYMRTFTNLGEMFKNVRMGKSSHGVEDEISRRVRENVAKKLQEENEEEEEE